MTFDIPKLLEAFGKHQTMMVWTPDALAKNRQLWRWICGRRGSSLATTMLLVVDTCERRRGGGRTQPVSQHVWQTIQSHLYNRNNKWVKPSLGNTWCWPWPWQPWFVCEMSKDMENFIFEMIPTLREPQLADMQRLTRDNGLIGWSFLVGHDYHTMFTLPFIWTPCRYILTF